MTDEETAVHAYLERILGSDVTLMIIVFAWAAATAYTMYALYVQGNCTGC